MKKENYTTVLALLLIALLGWMLFNPIVLQGDDSREEKNAPDSTIVSEPKSIVRVDTSFSGLLLYYPSTDSLDLRCLIRPKPEEDIDIIFCCAAAYTGTHPLGHGNIAGDHVSGGKRFRGYPCTANSGAFVYYKKHWKFLYKEYSHELDSASLYSGMGFGQEMIIHDGVLRQTERKDNDFNTFRALCELDGQLCVVESSTKTSFGHFKELLMNAGIAEAINTDMGDSWNYSWYRISPRDSAIFIHSSFHPAATNWLVFYTP